MTATALLPWVADVGRRFTLTVEGKRPLTTNKVADMNRFAWAAVTKKSRRVWLDLAASNDLPRLDRCVITVTPLHKDNRSPQDPAACAPEAKAAIDGLVDAGVLADDNGRHLLAVAFLPPEVTGCNGLRLTITEVLP